MLIVFEILQMNKIYEQEPYSDDIMVENNAATTVQDTFVIYIEHNRVDTYAMDAISALSKTGTVTLRSKGRNIPIAVTVANMVTYEIMKNESRVRKILLDTTDEPGIGRMISTVEIQLEKK